MKKIKDNSATQTPESTPEARDIGTKTPSKAGSFFTRVKTALSSLFKKRDKKERSPSEKAVKARAFFKRYWYWFVVIPVLVGVVIGWCFAMGYFDEPEIEVNQNEELNLFPGAYYVLDVDANRSDVSIRVLPGYEDKILVKDNVLYAQKNGYAFVEVKNGKELTTYLISIQPVIERWFFATGDVIPASVIYDLGNNLYRGALGYTNTDYTVFDSEHVEETDEDVFVAKSAGNAIMRLAMDELEVCDIFITVEDDMPEEKKYYSTGLTFLGNLAQEELAKGDKTKVRKEVSLLVGELYTIDDFTFSGGGNVIFQSSSERVTAYQNGVIYALIPGTTYVSVVCATDVGMDYYTVKVTVKIRDAYFDKREEDGASRSVYVGETVEEEELLRIANHDFLKEFEPETGALQLISNDPYFFKAVSASDKEVIINAYMHTESGRYLAIRYHLTITEKGEETEEDE